MGILNKFKFCWHKWKYVYSNNTYTFLGEKCSNLIKAGFRICEKCGKAQKFRAMYKYQSWKTLSDCETRILLSKIIDKENYFLLEKTHNLSPPIKVIYRRQTND